MCLWQPGRTPSRRLSPELGGLTRRVLGAGISRRERGSTGSAMDAARRIGRRDRDKGGSGTGVDERLKGEDGQGGMCCLGVSAALMVPAWARASPWKAGPNRRRGRPARGDEGGNVRSGCAAEISPQGHDRQETDHTDDDNGGFEHPRGHKAERDRLVLPPDRREQRHGRGRASRNHLARAGLDRCRRAGAGHGGRAGRAARHIGGRCHRKAYAASASCP